MNYVIVGLGNQGEEYEGTRHNTGRGVVDVFARTQGFPEWKHDSAKKALVSKGSVGKHTVTLVLPETYMNRSGASVLNFVKTSASAKRLVVVYDELDLPLGRFKISFARGSGGHRGVESVRKSLKTKDFYRFRIGISSSTPGGKLRKPSGEQAVIDFILGAFKPSEKSEFKKVVKKAIAALELFIKEGSAAAMNEYN